jgi:signal transduction histidine kinase
MLSRSKLIFILSLSLFFGNSVLGTYVFAIDETELQSLQSKADSCFNNANYKCALASYRVIKSKALLENDSLLMNKQDFNIAEIYYQQGKLDSAAGYYKQVIRTSRLLSDFSLEAKGMAGLAHVQWRLGDNTSAVRNILNSIDYNEYVRDTTELIKSKTILAGIYLSLKRISESKILYDDILSSAIAVNDTPGITLCYDHLGVAAYFNEDYTKALSYYKKSLALNTKIGDSLAVAINQANIGEAYHDLNESDIALDYLKKSLKTLQYYQFNSAAIFVHYTMGRVFNSKREFEKAQHSYEKSLLLMAQTGEIRERNYVYKLISENFEDQGKYKQALSYHVKYSDEKDSLFNVEKNRQLEEVRAKYQLEESENENMMLNLENKKAQEELSAQDKLLSYQYILTAIISISLIIFIIQFYVLRKSKKKLEVANSTKNRLFNIIAHDIKNPVSNINSLVNILKQSKSDAERERMFDMLNRSSQSISILVNNILSWSISNREGFQFKYSELNLHDLVKQVIGLFIYQISEKNIEIENNILAELTYRSDEDAISTIFRNLISNAIKYTHPRGTISISIEEKSEQQICLHVRDTGVGMDKKTINRVLNNENVLSEVGTKHEKGTGIGYTLVKDFVEKLSGTIRIESEPNKGTEVIVCLPNNLS